MREQYNSYDQWNTFDSNFDIRNMPYTNMNPNAMNSNFMSANIMDESMMINTNMDSNQNPMNTDLATPEAGFMQGNLFNNLYEPYKNYRPMRLVPTNEQAEMLLNANQFLFASHELRLYLDVFPEDANMIRLFNQYRSMANRAVKEYEEKYGPLTWEALSNPNEFSWQTTAWPWEMGVM